MSAPMFRVTPALFRLVSVVVVVSAIFVPDLSDGASVQIPEGVPTTTSTILMDVPSSLSQPFIKSQSVVPGVSSPFQGLSLQTGRSQTTSLIEERIQPSHVAAQCRAMCLEKYAPNEGDIDDAVLLPSLSPNEMEQETATPRQSGKLNDKEILLLLPNLLRFKRQRRSTPFSCTLDLSSDCYSCWNSCQLLEESSGNMPEAVPTTTFSDAKTEQGTPSILPCSNNKHCTSGCQVACSFYEQLLLQNGGMLISEEEIKETTTLASEDIAITTEVNDNGEIEVTQGSWEDESETLPATAESLDVDKIPTTTVVPTAPFELHLVSLIHQKPLVIAELRWDDVGGNANQEYLITWELTGGGLKGHLVTDSTSVTLSLWPDTTYQIQVEQFHLNLDSDGEQRAENSESSTVVKSLPLIVDTSVASFPLHSPSTLLIDDDEDDDDDEAENYSEDEFTAYEVTDKEDLETCYKSIGLIVVVVCAAVVFVFVLLVVVSCAKIRLQRLSSAKVNEECDSSADENGCFPSSCLKGCGSDEKDVRLLVSKEDSRHSSIYSWPLHYVMSEKRNDTRRHSNLKCQQNDMPAIAVLSPISLVPMDNATHHETQASKLSHCYSNIVFSQSTSDLPIVLSLR